MNERDQWVELKNLTLRVHGMVMSDEINWELHGREAQAIMDDLLRAIHWLIWNQFEPQDNPFDYLKGQLASKPEWLERLRRQSLSEGSRA